jgi:hypothetical protein
LGSAEVGEEAGVGVEAIGAFEGALDVGGVRSVEGCATVE